MKNQMDMQLENPENVVPAKKNWIKPAMKTLNTDINGGGDGDSEGGSGSLS